MKSLFNPALLKEQLKRFWAIGVISFAVYFLCCLMPVWNNSDAFITSMEMLSILEMKNPFIFVSNIVAPLAAVIAIFSYMYRQNSTGAIHALPFTKTQLFATNLLAGYLLIVVPLLIFSLLLVVVPVRFSVHLPEYSIIYRQYSKSVFPNGLSAGDVLNTAPIVCGFFARTLLSFTFYYALFLTAAMLVGKQIVYLLVSAVLPFLAVIFYLLFGLVSLYFVYGFSLDADLVNDIIIYSNPLALSAGFAYMPANEPYLAGSVSLMPYYVTYICITLALAALSAWLYHVRRLERAGDTLVFTPVRNFFIFLLALIGMMALGTFLCYLFKSIAAMYVGFVIGFMAAFFIAQMIVEKSFNVFYKYKDLLRHGSVAVGLFVAIVVISKADLTGYVRYMPKASEVEGVYLGRTGNIRNSSEDDEVLDRMFISDPEIIEEAMSMHSKIIDARGSQRKVFLDAMASNNRSGYTDQFISYRLKNGRIVYREYVLSNDFFTESGLMELMLSEPVIFSEIYWTDYPEELGYISITPYYIEAGAGDQNDVHHNYSSVAIYTQSEIESLMEALRQDYIQYKTNILKNNLYEITDMKDDEQNRFGFRFYVDGRTKDTDGERKVYHFFSEYYDNTFKWLDRHGYSMTGVK